MYKSAQDIPLSLCRSEGYIVIRRKGKLNEEKSCQSRGELRIRRHDNFKKKSWLINDSLLIHYCSGRSGGQIDIRSHDDSVRRSANIT